MQTVNNIRRQAIGDLRRRIFRSGVFHRQDMKDLANALVREHTVGMSSENLLALARHDTWLKSNRGGRPYSQYPGEKTQRIAGELESFLRSELRILVDQFWEGRTSVELVVKRSSAELAGFFNGVRPDRKYAERGLHDDAHMRRQAPYV